MDRNNTSFLHSVWIFIFMVWFICMLAFMWFCTSCQLSATAGRQCMNLVDSDRAQVAREAGYTVTLTSLQPLSCSPKNNLLIGQKRSAATSWSCNRFSLARKKCQQRELISAGKTSTQQRPELLTVTLTWDADDYLWGRSVARLCTCMCVHVCM